MRRIVITGLGVIAPGGTGKDTFWKSMTSGKSGISTIDAFDCSEFSTRIAGQVRDFDPLDFAEAKEARRMDRFSQFAVGAATLALDDAGLKQGDYDPARAGSIIGSGVGGISTLEEQLKVLTKSGPRRVSPFLVPMMISNLAAGHVSIRFGLKGPSTCVVTACATGAHSIGDAFEVIKIGRADLCVAGGTEAPLSPLGVAGFCAMKALSTLNEEPTKASRPFDKLRDGFVMAEGAGIVVLEELEHALARGAHVYAELVGYGMTADAYHITAPDGDGDGAIRAMRQALEEAALSPADIGYVNAHGTSTYYNDKVETLAIKQVFGDRAYDLPVSSTKSMTGHLLGAAGGVEAVVSALVLENGVIPPTINYEHPDPECDLNYVPNRVVKADVEAVMSNSFGFGGQNAVLIMRKYR